MAKQTVTLHMYEYLEPWRRGTQGVDQYDYRKFGDAMKERIYLGSTEVEINFPDVDTRQLQIDALEAQIKQEQTDSQVRVNLLLERISKLQAICHEVAE